MTLLAVTQTLAKRLILPAPSTVIGNTEQNVILMLAMLELAGKEIRDQFSWPELHKEYTFTLATDTGSYALPSDFNSVLFETHWNRDQSWPLIGPLSPQQWQTIKSGITSTVPRARFRVKGYTSAQFFIDPVPGSGENGQTLVYEYTTKTWLRPKTWIASTSWAGMQYCFYNGNIYDRGGTGAATTGTTPPTHLSGSVSDGSITWTYYGNSFETFNHDNDEIILDQEDIIAGAVWRFKREKGLFYEEARKDAEDGLTVSISSLQGANTISWSGGSEIPPMIGPWSYPNDGYYQT